MLFPPFLAWVWATFTGVLLLPFFPFQLDKRSPSSKSLKKNLSPPTRTEPIETSAHYNIIIDYFSLCSFSVCIVPSFQFFIQLLKGKITRKQVVTPHYGGKDYFWLLSKFLLKVQVRGGLGVNEMAGRQDCDQTPDVINSDPNLTQREAIGKEKKRETLSLMATGNW